jgi:hypothetical protein
MKQTDPTGSPKRRFRLIQTEVRKMKATQSFKTLAIFAAFTAIVLAGMLSSSLPLRAQDNYEESLIQQGFAIAPVLLNLTGKDFRLVGLGSYLVNAVGDCNTCHTSGDRQKATRKVQTVPA